MCDLHHTFVARARCERGLYLRESTCAESCSALAQFIHTMRTATNSTAKNQPVVVCAGVARVSRESRVRDARETGNNIESLFYKVFGNLAGLE